MSDDSGPPTAADGAGTSMAGGTGAGAHDLRVLHQDEIKRLAPLADDAFDRIADGFVRLASGDVRQPPVLSLDLPEARGEVDVKTAYVPGWDSFCVKLSTGFFANPERGLPTASGLMIVLSSETGVPRALLLDGGYLTDLRTAIAGAVAARSLAREDARHAAIVGAGSQARWQVRALSRVRDLEEVAVWARRPDAADAFARDMEAELGLRVRPRAALADAVADADVVVTTTPAHEPLLDAAMLSPGTHVTAMGSDAAGKRELAPDLLRGVGRVFVDAPSQSRAIGELQGLPSSDEGGPEVVALGDVLAGRAEGRTSEGDVTVCDLTGTGVQDTVIARWALERAAG